MSAPALKLCSGQIGNARCDRRHTCMRFVTWRMDGSARSDFLRCSAPDFIAFIPVQVRPRVVVNNTGSAV